MANREDCYRFDHPAQIVAFDEKLNLWNSATGWKIYPALQEFCIFFACKWPAVVAKIKVAELCSSLNSIICCLKGACKRHLDICIKPQRSPTFLEAKILHCWNNTADQKWSWVDFKDRAPVDPHTLLPPYQSPLGHKDQHVVHSHGPVSPYGRSLAYQCQQNHADQLNCTRNC